jgi:hypothetical protein
MLLTVLAAVAGIALGFWAGFAAGRRIAGKPGWIYWSLNLVALAIGLTVDIVGLTVGSMALAGLGLALFAGGISGLKYGYGRTLGLWKAADALFGATKAIPGASGPRPYHEIPTDEPGLVTRPLGRDRDVEPKGRA